MFIDELFSKVISQKTIKSPDTCGAAKTKIMV